jgi:hypothetical protein
MYGKLTLHAVDVSQNALALAFFTFLRNFAQVPSLWDSITYLTTR